MAINFNQEPYYDDFDETNQYYRILFKPGYAVQARELTQLQTTLQDQIKKLGTNVFVDGTTVIGGEKSFETSLIALRINLSYNTQALTATEVNALVGKTITGDGTKVQGFVKQVVFGTDYHTLIVKITSGSNFNASENILINSVAKYTIVSTNPYNTCTLFSVKSGIFFVNGFFVYSPAQSVLVDQLVPIAAGNFVSGTLYRIAYVGNTDFTTLGAQSNTVGATFVATGTGTSSTTGTVLNVSSKNIGFVITESTVSSEDDEFLLDNAQGSFNYAAPGADRYHITLTLTIKGLTDSVDNFIELARVDHDQYVVTSPNTVYNTLGKEMARRTFDESGNYTVSNFPLILKDNIDGISTKFTAALDPGKAYVSGYEFETKNQSYLTIDRARTTLLETNPAISSVYGNYINVTNVSGELITTNNSGISYTIVELHNVPKASVTGATTVIGTAQARYIKYISGTPGGTYTSPSVNASAIYRLYLFNVQINSGKYFKDVESFAVRTGNVFGADVDLSSKFNVTIANPTGDAFLSGADKVGLVFPLYHDYVSTVKDTVPLPRTGYTFQRTYQSILFNSSGIGTLSTANGNERFIGGAGLYSSSIINQNYHVVVTSPGSSGIAAGTVIDMSAAGRTITGGVDTAGAAQSLTLSITGGNGLTATVITTIVNQNQPERSKTLSGYTAIAFNPVTPALGNRFVLGKADGYDLLAVYNTSTTNPATQLVGNVNSTTGAITWGAVPHTDVTRNYTFDNGQRDDMYDYASIVASSTPLQGSGDYLVAVFRYFTHTGNGFLSVDSYPSATIPYTSIPTFKSPTTGINYNLRDCLDFRPRKNDASSTTFDGGQLPDPTGSIYAALQYYLGRKDVILAMPSKQFSVKTGTPSVNPQQPLLDSDGMALYVLTIPPYTADLNTVSVQYIDNRRYTMRDIGKIEKRVGNIEYYTQLSLLEKQAKDDSIPDAANLQKFKNGIIVDPFAGHNIGDALNNDYRCAIDLQRQEVRAFSETYNSEFTYTSTGSSSTSRIGDLVTLNYTESVFASQPFATTSININPFNIVAFVGSVSLEPSQDLWVDTLTVPPLNITNDISQTVNVFKPIQYRTVGGWWWGWNWGWNYGWGWGGWGSGWWGGWNTGYWGGWWGGWGNTSSSATTTSSSTSVTSSTESLGTNVIDLQFLPFIRQRTIFGKASGLKPKTRHYPFIDEKPITSQVRPLMVVKLNNITGTFNDSVGVYETVTFRSTTVSGTVISTANVALYTPVSATNTDPTLVERMMYIYNVSAAAAIISGGTVYVVGSTSGAIAKVAAAGYITVSSGSTAITASVPALGNAVYTDSFGLTAFEFQIPAGTYRCGERKVRLIDNDSNNTTSSQSSGDATYFALGQIKTERETLLTTRTTTTTITSQTTVTQFVGWGDPLAQSFLVDGLAYPNGLHLSSIDLYFRLKSTNNIPVTVELRKMINGYPESSSTISFGRTTLFPDKVNVSEISGDNKVTVANLSATNFKFPSPVYLPAGEYCFVVMSNCNEYEVYISEMGANLLGTNTRVTQQPYAGVMFKSQNGTTWSAIQEDDMKFNLNRCVFAYNGVAQFTINDPVSYTTTGTVSNTTNQITNVPAAAFSNLGLGMIVTGINGLAGVFSPGTTITGASYTGSGTGTITLSSTPLVNASGFTLYGQYEFGTLNVNASIISPSATNISLVAKTMDKGTSTYDSTGVAIVNKTDYEFASIKKVIPASSNSNTPTLQITATLSTTSDAVSPAVDVGRFAATMVKNVINNDATGETSSTGGNALCRYITKKVTLADGFDSSNLVVSMSAYKPFGTNIRVYYKTLAVEKTSPIDSEPWIEMIPESSVADYNTTTSLTLGKSYIIDTVGSTNWVSYGATSNTAGIVFTATASTVTPLSSGAAREVRNIVGYSTSASDYRELRFFPANAYGTYNVPISNPISPRFNNFQIKVVLLSTTEAITPKIRDFRGIALDY